MLEAVDAIAADVQKLVQDFVSRLDLSSTPLTRAGEINFIYFKWFLHYRQ